MAENVVKRALGLAPVKKKMERKGSRVERKEVIDCHAEKEREEVLTEDLGCPLGISETDVSDLASHRVKEPDPCNLCPFHSHLKDV